MNFVEYIEDNEDLSSDSFEKSNEIINSKSFIKDGDLVSSLKYFYEYPVIGMEKEGYKLSKILSDNFLKLIYCMALLSGSDSSIERLTLGKRGGELNEISKNIFKFNDINFIVENLYCSLFTPGEINFDKPLISIMEEKKFFNYDMDKILTVLMKYAFMDSYVGRYRGPRGVEADEFLSSSIIKDINFNYSFTKELSLVSYSINVQY